MITIELWQNPLYTGNPFDAPRWMVKIGSIIRSADDELDAIKMALAANENLSTTSALAET